MKPRILFLINSLCGGGAERIMSTVLARSGAKRKQFDISLALLDIEPRAYPVPDWVDVHQLDCGFSLLRGVVQLRRLMRRLEPDCVVSFLTRANVVNCLVTPAFGKPAIISERINTDMQLGSGARGLISKAIVRYTYPRASRVIAVARGVADTLVRNYRVARPTIEVIPNPVDVDSIRAQAAEKGVAVPPSPFVFAMGRLVDKKNFQLLVRAFAQSGIPCRLMIAGDGPQKKPLLDLALGLGIADRLLLPGFLDNPYPVLARADTFVLPSSAEGFPNALVEALSLGVPCIATNCADGPAEILAGVDRGQIERGFECAAGVLVPVNDCGALSAALQKMQDPDLRERIAVAGEARARLFSVESSIEAYWNVIEQELGC